MSASELKRVVLANLRELKEHRVKAARERVLGCSTIAGGPTLQEYYDRWSELSELERACVFRLEAARDREESRTR